MATIITEIRPSKTAGKTTITYAQVLSESAKDRNDLALKAFKTISTEKWDKDVLFEGKTYKEDNIILVELEPKDYVDYIDKNGNPAIQTKKTVIV